jgi:Common central domain of tyrosinase/Polyphenol oxidase middle domain
MTFTRRDAWSLSVGTTWPVVLEFYARAVRDMQARPLSDPTSWRYQAAVHGLANTPPPPGAPWNECQHSSWYFLPWHRMYLYQFERIVRSAVIAQGGPADWAVPYWNYEGPGQSNRIPPAFRAAALPDGSPNPLLVSARRAGINTGGGLPAAVTSSSDAANTGFFTTPSAGAPVGFGGPRTGFAHFGPAPGALENQPHNIMHVAVGGASGLMSRVETAALDPIFWLHHANIDRLWEEWRLDQHSNPSTLSWEGRRFRLRDDSGQLVRMRVGDVVDTTTLDYTYDSLPLVAARAARGDAVAPRSRPKTVGQSGRAMRVGREGASMALKVGPLPSPGAGASRRREPRFHLRLSDIEGQKNPGIVYGVYVHPPGDVDSASEQHRVGLVSFFGVEHSTKRGSDNPQPLTYTFDITDVIQQLGARGAIDNLEVSVLPMEGMVEDLGAAASVPPPLKIGSIAIIVS